MIINYCLVCEEKIITYPSEIKAGKDKFCSKPCFYKYRKGKKQSKEHIAKRVGKINGENNGNWKGDKVGMVALHDWVKRHLGYPDTCEYCGKSGLSGNDIHWANKSREYKRDLDDWVRLCVYCHLKYDDSAFKKGLASIEHRQGCSCFRCIGRRNRDMPAMSKRTRYS